MAGCSEDDKTVTAPDPNPQVTITSPVNMARVADVLVVEATATDDKGVALVEFYVDTRFAGSDPAPPYRIQWNVSSLPHGSEHSVYAVAWDTDDRSTGSVPVIVTIDTSLAAPLPVVLNQPTNVTTAQITLTWSKSPDIDFAHYRLRYDTNTVGDIAGIEKTLSTQTDTSWTVTGLLDSVKYRFEVVVWDLAGHSAPSNVVAGTTLNAPPPTPTVVSILRKSDRISFRWNQSTAHDFGSYRVIRSVDSTLDIGDEELAVISNKSTVAYDYLTSDQTAFVYFIVVADKFGLKSASLPALESTVINRNALLFNGTTYCTVPYFSALDLGHTYTLEAWVNQTQTSDFMRVIDKSPTGDPYLQYSLISDSRLGADFCGGGSPVRVHGDVGVTLNEWHHIALTYDHGFIVYFIDGAPVDTSLGYVTVSCGFPTTLNIGRRKMFNEFYFRGTIDDVRVWNVVRTPAEMIATFDKHLTGAEVGLVCYYDFDEGQGNTINSPVGGDGYLGETSGSDGNDPVWVASTAPIDY
jgi:hypothetical protein